MITRSTEENFAPQVSNRWAGLVVSAARTSAAVSLTHRIILGAGSNPATVVQGSQAVRVPEVKAHHKGSAI